MKTKVVDYDKKKAKWKFVQFKLLEIIGAFLFLWGFNPLGRIVYNNYNFLDVSRNMGYVGLWFYGLLSTIVSLFILFIAGLIVWGIFELVKAWIESNWEWAKSTVEDSESKALRLKEKEKLKLYKKIENKEQIREKYGVCGGDVIKLSKNYCYDDGDTKLSKGKKYEVLDDGEEVIGDYEDQHIDIRGKNYIIVKKVKIPKKPELNKKYIKERTETK